MISARSLWVLSLVAVFHANGVGAQAVTLSPLCKVGHGVTADACGSHDSLVWVGTNRFPAYPDIMRSAGIPGEVEVTFRLGTGGYVEANTMLYTRSTHRAFEGPVTRALLTWRLEHRRPDGSPAADSLAIRVAFRIAESCPDTAMHSYANWLPEQWPPEIVVSACPNVLVPRDGVF